MAETVTLENLTRRSKVVILDHPAFRNKKWGFRRIGQQSLAQQKDGSVTATLVRRSIIGSIRLPGRGKVVELHPAIVYCSQVKRWLAKGEVRIKAEADQTATLEAKAKADEEAKAKADEEAKAKADEEAKAPKATKTRRTSSTPDTGESA